MVWPKPDEVAILGIDGMEYKEWESVQVRHSYYEVPNYTARFTCSEGVPIAKNLETMRIIPGQQCTVILGGQLAVTGFVYSRQVFYDSKRHFVEIQAGSDDIVASYSSIIHKSMEWKKVTADQFIRQVTSKIGLKWETIGGQLPNDLFERLSMAPSTSVMQGVEMVLRQLGNYPLTSSVYGGMRALVNPVGGEDTIYEGDLGWPAILEGREILYNPGVAKGRYTATQGESNDKKWATTTKSEPFKMDLAKITFMGGNSPLATILEIPTINPDKFLGGRNSAEKSLQQVDEITVTATVQGWKRPSGQLWDITQKVKVKSPMLVMDGSEALIPKSITFSQDNQSGTRTTMVLCNETALGRSRITSTQE